MRTPSAAPSWPRRCSTAVIRGAARAMHAVEAFGPVCTIVPYETSSRPSSWRAVAGGVSPARCSPRTMQVAAQLVLGLAPYHGRIVVVNRHCAKESTGHGSPLPHLVHGGPGRAGGGEEMGGIRGVMHYMQRTAVQGTPDVITAVTGRWVTGARQVDPGVHPFRKPFGDAGRSATRSTRRTRGHASRTSSVSRSCRATSSMRTWTRPQAARNPLFGGRVAHGYFLVSAAAGLFVEPRRTVRCSPTTGSTGCGS